MQTNDRLKLLLQIFGEMSGKNESLLCTHTIMVHVSAFFLATASVSQFSRNPAQNGSHTTRRKWVRWDVKQNIDMFTYVCVCLSVCDSVYICIASYAIYPHAMCYTRVLWRRILPKCNTTRFLRVVWFFMLSSFFFAISCFFLFFLYSALLARF